MDIDTWSTSDAFSDNDTVLKVLRFSPARRPEDPKSRGWERVRLWPCFLGLDCDQLEEFPRKTISRDTNIYLAVI